MAETPAVGAVDTAAAARSAVTAEVGAAETAAARAALQEAPPTVRSSG